MRVRRASAAGAQQQNQARSISRAEAPALLAAVRRRSPLHQLLVCVLFFNGLRASEAAAADLEEFGEHDGHRASALYAAVMGQLRHGERPREDDGQGKRQDEAGGDEKCRIGLEVAADDLGGDDRV